MRNGSFDHAEALGRVLLYGIGQSGKRGGRMNDLIGRRSKRKLFSSVPSPVSCVLYPSPSPSPSRQVCVT
jgi:hypothetical protein